MVRRQHRGQDVSPLGAGVFIIILLLFALWVTCNNPRAEPVSVPQFNGIATDIPAQSLDLTQARKSVGWLYEEGHLVRETFELLNTKSVIANGLTWLAKRSSSNEVLFYDYTMRSYAIDGDTAMAIAAPDLDTVGTVQGDSNITRSVSGQWLNMTLPNSRNNVTVTINGVPYKVAHFLSDTVLWLRKAFAESDDATATLSIGFPFNQLSAGSIETGDTLWFYDGDNLTFYVGLPFPAITYPTYADAGTFDSIATAAGGGPYGDSIQIYGNFNATIAGKYILWEDSLWSRRAIPMYVHSLKNNGSANEYIVVYCDSAFFATENHFGTVATPGVSTPLQRRYVADSLPIYANYYDTTITGNVCDKGTYGNMRYYRILLMSPPVRWRNTRAMDAALYRAPGYGPYGLVPYRAFTLKIDSCYGADSTVIKAFGHSHGDSLLTGDGISLAIYNIKPKPVGSITSQQTWPYSIGILHRRVANYAGNDTGVTIFAWTDQAHYDSIVGSERLEGRAAITGFISSGQELAIIREDQSVLRGGVAGAKLDNSESRSGFSEDDWYLTPIQAILSGNFTIGPLGLGIFSSGGIREIPTRCNSIFSDSINWAAGERIVAAIYQGRLWLGVPFGSSATNNRCLVLDLAAQPVNIGFVAMKPGSFLVRRDAGIDEQLYIGQADSSNLWLVGGTADRYEIADWRSGWYDGGDLSRNKFVKSFQIDFTATTGDSIWCDFYKNFSETAVWSDTIVATGGPQTHHATVHRSVQGYVVAYGIRTPDKIAPTGFQLDVVVGGRVRRQ